MRIQELEVERHLLETTNFLTEFVVPSVNRGDKRRRNEAIHADEDVV
jgi:hypothetical protein